jgi:hypothetical protein
MLKTCIKCEEEKDEALFKKSSDIRCKSLTKKMCKACDAAGSKAYREAHPEEVKEGMRRYRKANLRKIVKMNIAWGKRNPEKKKNLVLRSRYNITIDQFNEILKNQDNKCIIFLVEFSNTRRGLNPNVDHDHKCCPEGAKSCGKCVRGLICGSCNRMLGRLKDDPANFERVLEYLKKEPIGATLCSARSE